MRIYKKKVKLKENQHIRQYPVVQNYKYLGVTLYHSLDPREHLKTAVIKSAYIRNRLFGLRRVNSFGANVNLFRVLIIPAIKMVAAFYDM